MATPTGALTLGLFVEEVQWLGLFDALEIWRSRVGEAGPYEPVTGAAWAPARFPHGSPNAPLTPVTGPPLALADKTLTLWVNGEHTVEVTFSGPDPFTPADAGAQIVAAAANFAPNLLTFYVVQKQLVLETTKGGTGSSIQVLGGDAAPMLGFSTSGPDSVAFGQEARIPLLVGQTTYELVDLNGSAEFFYKTRFYNTSTISVSEFSDPISPQGVAGLNSPDLVRGVVDLVDGSGVALANRAVLLHMRTSSTIISGRNVLDDPREVLTDSNGHAEFTLVRGQLYSVAIGGTDLVRDFTAPTDSEVVSFNLLDPAYSSDDAFAVQKPDLRYAVRRSM